jgi:hypothetical protein
MRLVYAVKCRLKERRFCRHIGCVSVEQMQSEIAKLTPEEFRKLADWIDEMRAEDWDRQIEADVASGKLDRFADEAIAEYRAGKTKPFPK